MLDAGVALLEERGYEAFTIAAVCERAQVVPRFLYARVDSKEALFLAVYEYGTARIRREAAAAFADDRQWRGLPPGQVVQKAVHEVIGLFQRHSAFMRSVVQISGVHAEVNRRGSVYSRELGDAFTGRLLAIGEQIDAPDPGTAVRAAFSIVFAAVIIRVTYGPSFATPHVDDGVFLETLTAMVCRYLGVLSAVLSVCCDACGVPRVSEGNARGLPPVAERSMRGPRQAAGSRRPELRNVSTARAAPARRSPNRRKPVTWVSR